MINLTQSSVLLSILGTVFLALLIAWLIYRNRKDEKKFEKNMDDPHQQSVRYLKHKNEKI